MSVKTAPRRQREKKMPGACWPASLADLVSSRFSERWAQKIRGKDFRKARVSNWCVGAWVHECACVHHARRGVRTLGAGGILQVVVRRLN